MARGIAMERSLPDGKGDTAFLGVVVLLAGAGLAYLYSASSGYALALGKRPDHFFVRQAWAFAPAMLAFALGAFTPVDVVRRRAPAFAFVALGLLFLPFVPGIGVTRNGAARWIGAGSFTFQPSELWKTAVILYAAHLFSRKGDRVDDIVNTTLPPLFVTLFGSLVILAQNDFSTAVLAALPVVVLFWVAEVPLLFFVALSSVALPLAALTVLTSPFRLRRIITFLFPAHAPESIGYQLLGSVKAIRAGGLFGRGLGLGTVKLASVPEVQSDFVFASFAEETGFFGVAVFLAVWAFFAWRAFRVSFAASPRPEAARETAEWGIVPSTDRNAGEARTRFVSYASFGLAASITIQVLVNVGVASGAIPATGIPLPFFSAGGSSLLSTALMCGLIFNFSRASGQSGREGAGKRVSAEVVHG